MLLTASILITGKVQGVFYRQSAREKAILIGIKGKVMNLPDGNVEVIATGTRKQIDELIAWCRLGPPKATVRNVTVKEQPLQLFDQFEIVRL